MIQPIKKEPIYAEANLTIVGITTSIYDRPQYILVDAINDKRIKFPGLRFRPPKPGQSLEDIAIERFQEQTGLEIKESLGLRTVVTARSRERKQWMFRNVFFVVVDKISHNWKNPYNDRTIYVADLWQGVSENPVAFPIGESTKKDYHEWRTPDNHTVARVASEILNHFNWSDLSTNWYKRIPVVKVDAPCYSDCLGCGLGIASMMVFYKPSENEDERVLMAKRKSDEFPGYAGGKIETPESNQDNVTPLSCCAQEGFEEFGFRIEPRSLNCVACTPLPVPENPAESHEYYNSLITYNFVAEPANPSTVREALQNPSKFLRDNKIEGYCFETIDSHWDRIHRRELRMPDMAPCGEQFFRTTPAEKIPLTCFRSSGVY